MCSSTYDEGVLEFLRSLHHSCFVSLLLGRQKRVATSEMQKLRTPAAGNVVPGRRAPNAALPAHFSYWEVAKD